jgi:hypothetical protein
MRYSKKKKCFQERKEERMDGRSTFRKGLSYSTGAQIRIRSERMVKSGADTC